MSRYKAFRAAILHFTDTPDPRTGHGIEYFEDGVLLLRDGRVQAVGAAPAMAADGLDLATCEHYPNHLLMPGFIDTHVHYPQLDVIASYGEQLLDWLNGYTFPEEARYADADFAEAAAEDFLRILSANGTTSAVVYTAVYPQSASAFFRAAAKRNARMIAGKMMMDRNAPDALLDTAAQSEADSRELIERWHGQARLHYALTPRFAPTSTPEQLAAVGRLYREYPSVYLQTHLSENREEIAWVKRLFPDARDYVDVYDHFGLLGPGTIFGHGIHLNDREVERLAQTESRVAFCPTSNLFLGSGLLDLKRLEAAGIAVSLATDVGAGTSLSMLRTLADAYKVLQLQGQSLDPFTGLYWVTLGNARALRLEDCIGNFARGREGDFVLLDLAPTPLQKRRQAHAQSLAESLFALITLGDEHNLARTYLMGEPVFTR